MANVAFLFLLALSRAQDVRPEPYYDPAGPRAAREGIRSSDASPRGGGAANGGGLHGRDLAPIPGPDAPVMAGYDLVQYHNLKPWQDGVRGSPDISHRHSNGYLYYFSSEENRKMFLGDPDKYLPKYGGFCAWGIAWEYPEGDWPWAANHMGPPCGPSDGWAIIDGSLYCSIWRSYQDDFNFNQEEGIRLADERWIGFYGSLDGGPQNNGCYAWNWQECYRRSIHTSVSWEAQEQITTSPTPSPKVIETPAPTPVLFPSNNEGKQVVVAWSETRSALQGAVTWKWTLAEVETPTPSLIVEISAENVASDEYVAFGVAEQLMQGALVACSELTATVSTSRTSLPSSHCVTLVGDGMGTTVPELDPVKPHVLLSSRNATHYTVRFSASLFGCWAHPRLPARVLFARGKVAGDGAPQPHLNNGQNREAVPGVNFLTVVRGYDAEENQPPAQSPALELEPLPARDLWKPVQGSGAGSTSILDDRVTVGYEVFHHGGTDIVSIGLYNVEFVSEETYVAFGFAQHIMSGLVISCAPRMGASISDVTAICHQWRGQGTNLLPLDTRADAEGWFLTSVAGNGTHFNYTLAGRVHEVMEAHEGDGTSLLLSVGSISIRAICAIGRSAPDSGTPLIHQARDRVGFLMDLGDTSAPASSANSLKAILVLLMPLSLLLL